MDFLIDYFKNKQTFLKLQNYFSSKDFYNGMTNTVVNDTEIIKEDFSISEQRGIYNEDSILVGTEMIPRYFQKDYLSLKVKEIYQDFSSQVEYSIRRNYLGEIKERKNYILFLRSEINEILENIEQFNFLIPEVYESLFNQISKCSTLINDNKFLEANIFDIGKIKVKMNKYDFITLMMALRKNDLIETGTYDAEFARVIENSFTLYDEDSKSYKSVTDVNKLINGFAKGTKTNEMSKSRLAELFGKPDFFQTKEK